MKGVHQDRYIGTNLGSVNQSSVDGSLFFILLFLFKKEKREKKKKKKKIKKKTQTNKKQAPDCFVQPK